jgi:hypothetical protein
MKNLNVLLIEFKEQTIVFSKRILKIASQYIFKPLKNILKILWKNRKTVGSIVGFLGFLFTLYMSLKPVISISPSEPRFGQNVFTSYFIVKNNGSSSVENINFHFEFDEVNFGDDLHIWDTGLSGYCESITLLKPNSSQTLNCNILENFTGLDPIKIEALDAEITIEISYEFWTFFKRTKYFYFFTSDIRYGNVIWCEGHK